MFLGLFQHTRLRYVVVIVYRIRNRLVIEILYNPLENDQVVYDLAGALDTLLVGIGCKFETLLCLEAHPAET